MNFTVSALTDYFGYLWPEILLVIFACVLFLGGTWRGGRSLWGGTALVGLAAAGLALWWRPVRLYPMDAEARELARAGLYAGPVLFDHFALLVRVLALAGGAVLVLFSWDEVPDEQAAEYHACLLLMAAGMAFTAMANELVTLFLALELISIPTYVLLYLPRTDRVAQEAAMKYFLLSIFSSALTLFGFSYLYGLAGTTNMPALAQSLAAAPNGMLPGIALAALVMVVAGLGFRITAVPFHFYAPDVYQGTTTGAAAILAFVPKAAGFAALVRVLGFVIPGLVPSGTGVGLESHATSAQPLGEQVPVLLWIVAAVTMSLGNLLALLQDNVKRLLAYSSVAHAGYMLIGLAVAPRLAGAAAGGSSTAFTPVGGVEAMLFYLVTYGAMTIGAFAVLSSLSTPERPAETVDDLAGLGRSHPGLALVMTLFLFSLIGLPATGGFWGKLWLFLGAVSVPSVPDDPHSLEQHRLFLTLAIIGAVNAAIAAYYYLRIAAVMFLRDPLHPLPPARTGPVRAALWVCAAVALGVGLYPTPLLRAVQAAVPPRSLFPVVSSDVTQVHDDPSKTPAAQCELDRRSFLPSCATRENEQKIRQRTLLVRLDGRFCCRDVTLVADRVREAVCESPYPGGCETRTRSPENGSSASFSWQRRAKESIPLCLFTGSMATNTRICAVIWIILPHPARRTASRPNPAGWPPSSECASCRRLRTRTRSRSPPVSPGAGPSVPRMPAWLLSVGGHPLQVEEPQVGEAQAPPWQRRRGRVQGAVRGAARRRLGDLESPGDGLEPGQDLQPGAPGLGIRAAAAGILVGQGRRQGTAVLSSIATAVKRRSKGIVSGRASKRYPIAAAEDPAQAIDGPVVEPLLEGLDGDAQGGGEVLELGLRVGHPAEDQALDEAGAGDPADAADEAGVLGGLVGGRRQEGLQGGGQRLYADRHGRGSSGACLVSKYTLPKEFLPFLIPMRRHSPDRARPSGRCWPARTSCCSRSAKAAWAPSAWPSRRSPSSARSPSRSSSRAWTAGRSSPASRPSGRPWP